MKIKKLMFYYWIMMMMIDYNYKKLKKINKIAFF